jgi:N-acetylmuramate 1-kinase
VVLRNGRVQAFRAPVAGAPGTCTFAGVQVVRPEVVRHAPAEGFGTLVEVYEAGMRAGRHVLGTEVPGSRWADIGTPAQWLAAHDAWNPHPGPSGRGWRVARSPGTVCARGACAERCVLLPGARLERGARAHNAILAPGAVLRRGGEGLVVPADCALTDAELRSLGRLDPKGREAPWMAHRLPPRGSGRVFFRLEGAMRSLMLVRDEGARAENRRLAGHTRFLRRLGLPVPRVLAESDADRVAVYEDAGMRALDEMVRVGGWSGAWPIYARVIEVMARWHWAGARAVRRTRLPLEPPMRGQVFDYERQLFLREFFDPRLGGRRALRVGVESELRCASAQLRRDAQVLIHRDLQSSNILCPSSAAGEGAMPGGMRLIDFQGMRIGPALYDLASLLMDPYVEPPAELRAHMLDVYARRAGVAVRMELFGWAGVQRLTQALGAFARLGRGADGARFARHIPAGLRMLDTALDLTGAPLPHLRETARRLRTGGGG